MSAVVKDSLRAASRNRRAVIGSKGGAAKEKKPSVAQNGVPSISTAQITYLWSWGPIVGPVNGLRSIKLDGTPIQAADGTINYPSVKWQFRNGELNQPRLDGISESSNEIDVKQELIYGTPWLHTISTSVADAIRLRLSWPVLRSQDSSGNINGVRIDYAVDISTDNGPYVQVLLSFVDRKNVTEYERAHRLELPAGNRWTVRVRRITRNANSDLVADQMVVKAIAEVVDSDQEYPLTAVSSIQYDAQTFGGDIAKIAVLMRGRIIRVPANYDAVTRTYATAGTGTTNGIWNGTFKEAYTNNPAWIFYDLVLHPYYGLGDRIDATMVDRWSLYRIAQYCDQMVPNGKGGQEPRFTCNLYFQKQAEAYAVLQDLASIFHGLAYWDGSQIVVNADMPGDPVFTYNQTQILNSGAIKYEGTRARDRHTLYMVSWDNPDQGFETDKEPVFDDEAMVELGGIVRDTTVSAIGCTVLGQAQRAGQWAALTEKLQTQAAVFRVGLDGDIPKPGQVIAVADPMLVGRNNGGRIAAAAGRVITLDRDTVVPVGARLLVNLPSGKSEGRVIRSVAGRNVTLMANFSEQPQAECGWILDYEDLKLMQFYVRNVTRPEWHQYQLEVIQHEPSKFEFIDNGAVVDIRPITGIPVGTQAAPARVMLSQHVVVEQGIAVTVMSIAWDAAAGAVGYDVEWKWGARAWVPVPRTAEQMVDVRGIYSGQYMARVRAVSALNVSSIPVTSVVTNLLGKTGLPPAVSFLRTVSKVYGIGLEWAFPAGAEDTQRTEIWNNTVNNLSTATKLSDFSYPQARHELQNLVPGTSLFFWARLVDRTGNVGPWFPAVNGVNGQVSADQSKYEQYFLGKIQATALGPQLIAEIGKISGEGGDSVNARINAAKIELEALIGGITDALVYDSGKTYAAGEIVRLAGRLFSAIKAVPAGRTPPNAEFWSDIGTIAQTTDALAIQIRQHTTQIETINGQVSSQASTFQALQASMRDDGGEGSLNDALGGWRSTASIITNEKVRVTEDLAQATRVTTLDAALGGTTANLTTLEYAVATESEATAQRFESVTAKTSSTAASLSTLEIAVAKENEATARRIETVSATANGATAKAETASAAVSGLGGKVSALTTIKTSTTVGGRTVMAALAVGVDGEEQESQILAFAQRFAILDEVSGQMIAPFVVQGGQVFMNTAIISTAFIRELVLGMTLRSSTLNNQGLPLLEINIPAGTFTLRGQSDSGYTLLNNNGIYVYDLNYIERAALGKMT